MNTVEVMCGVAGCGHSPFPMNEAFYVRAKRTGETWYCPAGHARCFIVGKTEEQKRHEKELAEFQRLYDWLEELYDRESALARTCPWPTCRDYVYSSRSAMFEHMRRTHGMPTVMDVSDVA